MLAPSMSDFTLGSTGGIFQAPVLNTPAYNPGKQVYSPGETAGLGWMPQNYFNPVPWPSMVPTLNCMGGFFGFARQNPTPVVNNKWAPLFNNNMFIGDVVGKSQG